ncbi:MAG: hypothetical protein U1D00_28770, partial [Mycobacterium sp.]|nr:hypothetical protein [Mycobacterium sp.]
SLTRPSSGDYVRQVLRAVAPTQLAAAVMLAAGAVVGLSVSPPMSTVVLVVCIIGAVATVAAGCWQSAKAVLRDEQLRQQDKEASSCGGGACATCTLSCGS